jgi:mRNA interferase MazF
MDIIWLEFEPQAGKEIQKTRPAIVISPKEYNSKVGLALCMPITSKIKGYPFEVIISNNQITGAVLCDQMRSLDWKVRNARFITKCQNNTFAEVIANLMVLID